MRPLSTTPPATLSTTQEWCKHMTLNINTTGCAYGGPHNVWVYQIRGATLPTCAGSGWKFCPRCGKRKP